MDYKTLLSLRRFVGKTLDDIALETEISVGYLSRIEGGYIKKVKNARKKKLLESCLRSLQRQANDKYIMTDLSDIF